MSLNIQEKDPVTGELKRKVVAGNSVGVAKFGAPIENWLTGHSSAATAIIADRDGILYYFNYNGNTESPLVATLYVNGKMFRGARTTWSSCITLPISKGDTVFAYEPLSGDQSIFYPFVENIVQPIEGGEEYSTEEKVIGTWIDGKPLYQKSFFYEASYVEGWNNMDNISALNIDSLASLDANAHVTLGGGGWYKAPYVSRDNFINGFDVRLSGPDGTNQKSLLQVYKKGTALDTISVTIKYTKTTD